jgi:hypothetical protein
MSLISRRREMLADFYASILCGREQYLEFLVAAAGTRHADIEGGFFHPSLQARVNALLSDKRRFFSPSPYLVAWYSIMLFGFVMQYYASAYVARPYFSADSGPDALYLAQIPGFVLGILIELSRILVFTYEDVPHEKMDPERLTALKAEIFGRWPNAALLFAKLDPWPLETQYLANAAQMAAAQVEDTQQP